MGILENLGNVIRNPGNRPVQDAGAGAETGTAGKTGADTSGKHPGYSRIALWVRKKYGAQLRTGAAEGTAGVAQLAGEATAGLSEKTKKGFLEYLRRQNYEQLLK